MNPVLGIETSCDETAVAVLDQHGQILAEALHSQTREHESYGGVVPEIAARAHLKHLPAMVQQTVRRAGLGCAALGGIAATSGPGLIGGLIVGCQFGKGMAIAHNLPFVAVNHLEAHALTARMPAPNGASAAFPYLLLLMSGGHTLCAAVTGLGQYHRLGGTIDDAVGEAFDKTAKLLDLGWPGGPALEALAVDGDATRFPFPRPLLHRAGCDFSFSGLKTAVAQMVRARRADEWDRRERADLAASFQQAVLDVLADRTTHACRMMRSRSPDASVFVVAGGVAANRRVRSALAAAAQSEGFTLVAPPARLCSDNAVMVAWAGLERLRAGWRDDVDFKPAPRWPLEALRAPGR